MRFYVPETVVATLRIGDAVTVRCDGCGGDIPAKVRFIAPQAEFTPPVIYSRENRANLVFLVEARPDVAESGASPGLPVEVALAARARCDAARIARAATHSGPARDTAIDVRGLTKRYGGRAVVDNFSIRVERGTIFGFLGPNGSGKTTTIRMLCGLLTPDEGEGTCLGYDLRREAPAIKREVGYMTQRFSMYEDLSIEENLDFVARMYGVPDRAQAIDATLDRLGLTARRAQLAGTLSGGWKQRLALAACMLHSPQLLLLDEPTAGVDPKARRDFWEKIHELAAEGITVLVSTHYMDEAERCHRLAYIAFGQAARRRHAERSHRAFGTHDVERRIASGGRRACARAAGTRAFAIPAASIPSFRSEPRCASPARDPAALDAALAPARATRFAVRAYVDVARRRVRQPDAERVRQCRLTRTAAARSRFSFARAYAIALKEFVQMRRDRLTFAMIVGIPIAQVLLFGYVINTDPKALPTAVVDYDRTDFTRSIASTLQNTGYFSLVAGAAQRRGGRRDARARRNTVRHRVSGRILAAAAARRAAVACWSPPMRPTLPQPATRSRRCRRRARPRSRTT